MDVGCDMPRHLAPGGCATDLRAHRVRDRHLNNVIDGFPAQFHFGPQLLDDRGRVGLAPALGNICESVSVCVSVCVFVLGPSFQLFEGHVGG